MDKKLPKEVTTQTQTTTDDIEGLLELIKDKLIKLKNKLGFDNIVSEYNRYMQLKEQTVKNKTKLSMDDDLGGAMLGEVESLLGRLEDFELMSPEEVKQVKKYENPIIILR